MLRVLCLNTRAVNVSRCNSNNSVMALSIAFEVLISLVVETCSRELKEELVLRLVF